jgi:hypothetical protein
MFNPWVKDDYVTASEMPILEINEYPIRKLKVCVGCWYWGGHKDTWCNNVDPYTQCTYIDTPNSSLAKSYALLRESQTLLFAFMYSGEIADAKRMKEIIRELKDIIKTYEKHI